VWNLAGHMVSWSMLTYSSFVMPTVTRTASGVDLVERCVSRSSVDNRSVGLNHIFTLHATNW
jgi:hypothetical protein